VFDLVAGEEEGEFEGVVGKFGGIGAGDEELFDLGGGGGGFFAEDAEVDGDAAPAEELKAAAGDDLFGDTAEVGLGVVIGGGEEEGADGEVGICVEAVAEFFDFAAEKFVGDLGEDAGAVAGFGIGIEGAAVGELADATEGAFEDGVGFTTLDIGDETDTAGVFFPGGMVEALGPGKAVIQRKAGHVRVKGT
jgi:hypothetical protein